MIVRFQQFRKASLRWGFFVSKCVKVCKTQNELHTFCTRQTQWICGNQIKVYTVCTPSKSQTLRFRIFEKIEVCKSCTLFRVFFGLYASMQLGLMCV